MLDMLKMIRNVIIILVLGWMGFEIAPQQTPDQDDKKDGLGSTSVFSLLR